MSVRRICLVVALQMCATVLYGASPLESDPFFFSIENFPDNVGVTRVVTTCGMTGNPIGDDPPPETCVVNDHGTPPVQMTFNTGVQTIGGLQVDPRVTEFAGIANGMDVTGFDGLSVTLETLADPADVIEFRTRTAGGGFINTNPLAFSGFSATGLDYPNIAPDSEPTFLQEQQAEPVGDSYTGFFFWYTKDGVPASNYEISIPVGLAVGRHPTESDIEVVYILYSDGEVDENTDTPLGGPMDLHLHTSDLDDNPEQGNSLGLAAVVGLAPLDNPAVALQYNGFNWGVLVHRPATVQLRCDLNNDLVADAADAGIMFSNWGNSGAGDCSNDNIVDAADAGILFSEWTGDPTASEGTAAGEYNLVTGEIKVHANNVVNWYIQSTSGGLTGVSVGDLPGPGLVTDNNSRVGETALGKFAYSANLGNVAAPQLPQGDLVIYWNSDLGRPLASAPVQYVPEPAGVCLLGMGTLGLFLARRRR